jgi:radical SAM peptide maturase (CXXX-repeat target family)
VDYFQEATIREDHPWQYYFKVSISSNGTLYFNQSVQDFIKKHKQHLSYSISVDGNKKLHDACRVFPDGSGSYDMAIAAVHHYRDVWKGYMGSKVTISPDNVRYTAEAIIGLIESDYCDIAANCVFEKGWTEEHATIFYYELKKLADYLLDNNLFEKIKISFFDYRLFCPKSKDDAQNWCGGNGRMIAVDYKGDIFPCVRYMESSLGEAAPPLIIGNTKTGIAQTDICKACIT